MKWKWLSFSFSVPEEVSWRIICLKCRWWLLLMMMIKLFEIIFLYRDVGNRRKKTRHAGKLSQIQTDSLNQLSFPHTRFFFLLYFCRFADGVHFFFPPYFLLNSVCIALPYAEWHMTKCSDCFGACLVFQRCTLFLLFTHINLCWVFFLTVVLMWLRLICLYSFVIISCQSPSLTTYTSSHLIMFERLCGHWTLII